MPFEAKTSFAVFRKDVENALPKRSQRQKDYSAKAEALARLYRKRPTWVKDSSWVKWLKRAEDGFGDNWSEVSHLKQGNVRKIATGGSALNLAIAIHYCMHASDEFTDRAIASFLDKIAFGTRYAERSGPVFLYRPYSALTASYPKVLLPSTYQYGREEFKKTKAALLRHNDEASLQSANVALFGSGGYGKTAIASEICNDNEVREAFPGGIYWMQFGVPESESAKTLANSFNARDAIDRMLRTAKYLESDLKLIDQTNDTDAMKSLIAALPSEPLLVIADDLWTQAHVNAFSDLPTSVSLLVTTRVNRVRLNFDCQIATGVLSDEASFEILCSNLNTCLVKPLKTNQKNRLHAVSRYFNGWPLLLRLANATLRDRLNEQTPINPILEEFETFVSLEDVTGWDVREPGETEKQKRSKFVGHCIEAGLRALPDTSYVEALFSLGVFPDDTEIPFTLVDDFWKLFLEDRDSQDNPKVGVRISSIKSRAIRSKLNDLSYFLAYDPKNETLRIHDVFLAFFRRSHSPERLKRLHELVETAIKSCCTGGLETLPSSHTYGWKNILYHLDAQDKQQEADGLKTNYLWLKGKLNSVGATELRRSFATPSLDDAVNKIGLAVSLSLPVIMTRPSALALQIYGRLGHERTNELALLAENAAADGECFPKPIQPHLLPLCSERLRLIGHHSSVLDASFSFDENIALTASSDCSARLWNLGTGTELRKLLGHCSEVTRAAFSPDQAQILTTSRDCTARLWDVHSDDSVVFSAPTDHEILGSFYLHKKPHVLLSLRTQKSNSLFLWDLETGVEVARRDTSENSHFLNVFSSKRLSILSQHPNNEIKLWDWDDENRVRTFKIPSQRTGGLISASDLSEDGRYLSTDDRNQNVLVWDVLGGSEPTQLQGHKWKILDISLSSHLGLVFTTSIDRTARLWRLETGEEIERLEGHSGHIHSGAISGSGNSFLTSSGDGSVRLWGRTDSKTKTSQGQRSEAIRLVSFNKEGTLVLAACGNNGAKLWNSNTGEFLGALPGHTGDVSSAIFSPDNLRVAAISNTENAKVWNIDQCSQVTTLGDKTKKESSYPEFLLCHDFSPCGNFLATGSSEGRLLIWDINSGVYVDASDGHAMWMGGIFFSADGKFLFSVDGTGTSRIWDIERKITTRSFGEFKESKFLAGDESHILTKDGNFNIRVWKTKNGKVTSQFCGHNGEINSAVLSNDRRVVLSASSDKSARLWELDGGEEIMRFDGHDSWVYKAVFSECENFILTTSLDSNLRVWETVTGKLAAVVELESPSFDLTVHERKFAIGDRLGKVHIFEMGAQLG